MKVEFEKGEPITGNIFKMVLGLELHPLMIAIERLDKRVEALEEEKSMEKDFDRLGWNRNGFLDDVFKTLNRKKKKGEKRWTQTHVVEQQKKTRGKPND